MSPIFISQTCEKTDYFTSEDIITKRQEDSLLYMLRDLLKKAKLNQQPNKRRNSNYCNHSNTCINTKNMKSCTQGDFTKGFHQRQIQLNRETVDKQRKQYHNFNKIVQFTTNDEQSPQKVNDNSLEKSPRNDSYAQLLKDQLSMQHIEDENQLARSRKLDQQNSSYFREKYPYGCEGVKVREEVIEKYKASNYAAQRSVLQKFQKQAQQYRRKKIKRYQSDKHNLRQYRSVRNTIGNTHSVNRPRQLENVSFVSQASQNLSNVRVSMEFDQIRKKEREQQEKMQKKKLKDIDRAQRKRKRKQERIQRQKQNLAKVSNMLRDIDHKIKENSSKLADSLRELRNQLKPQIIPAKINEQKLFERFNRMNTNTQSNSKIPVIFYNCKSNESLNFRQYSQAPERFRRQDFKENSQNIHDLLVILRNNEERLKHLTQQGEDTFDYQLDNSF